MFPPCCSVTPQEWGENTVEELVGWGKDRKITQQHHGQNKLGLEKINLLQINNR